MSASFFIAAHIITLVTCWEFDSHLIKFLCHFAWYLVNFLQPSGEFELASIIILVLRAKWLIKRRQRPTLDFLFEHEISYIQLTRPFWWINVDWPDLKKISEYVLALCSPKHLKFVRLKTYQLTEKHAFSKLKFLKCKHWVLALL